MNFPIHNISFESIIRGIIGLSFIIILSFFLSSNRKAIHWKTVFAGIFLQILLGIGVVYIPFIFSIFEFIGKIFIGILDFTKEGSRFVFGDLVNSPKYGYIFAFQILPTIIFFSALSSVLYYYGITQQIVRLFAFLLRKLFRLSGAESLVTSANIFLGQTEAPLLIKSYLGQMSLSEIFLVMTAGMATLAGGVLAAYIGFLGGNDPVQKLLFAKHLVAASVMAAPGAIVISKMMVPQTETFDPHFHLENDKNSSNILDAISSGTTDGLKLAVNVAAMLIVFVAFIALFNFLASKLGSISGINHKIAEATNGKFTALSLQLILGYIFAPLMWLIGICPADMLYAGRLLGEKLVLTEFIGYISLTDLKAAGVFAQEKSIIMSAYFLSGFANFASIGIQIASIGTLAPTKKIIISKFGLKAMIAGALASLLSACLIGAFLG
jgi:concentrative nucleoside transporter, CNT family